MNRQDGEGRSEWFLCSFTCNSLYSRTQEVSSSPCCATRENHVNSNNFLLTKPIDWLFDKWVKRTSVYTERPFAWHYYFICISILQLREIMLVWHKPLLFYVLASVHALRGSFSFSLSCLWLCSCMFLPSSFVLVSVCHCHHHRAPALVLVLVLLVVFALFLALVLLVFALVLQFFMLDCSGSGSFPCSCSQCSSLLLLLYSCSCSWCSSCFVLFLAIAFAFAYVIILLYLPLLFLLHSSSFMFFCFVFTRVCLVVSVSRSEQAHSLPTAAVPITHYRSWTPCCRGTKTYCGWCVRRRTSGRMRSRIMHSYVKMLTVW